MEGRAQDRKAGDWKGQDSNGKAATERIGPEQKRSHRIALEWIGKERQQCSGVDVERKGWERRGPDRQQWSAEHRKAAQRIGKERQDWIGTESRAEQSNGLHWKVTERIGWERRGADRNGSNGWDRSANEGNASDCIAMDGMRSLQK
jgi:hypothetical protein